MFRIYLMLDIRAVPFTVKEGEFMYLTKGSLLRDKN